MHMPGLLPVSEIFETIQGEAWWTGTPAVFVRLQGCDVGCPWCDTKYTWPVKPSDAIPIQAMLAKDGTNPTTTYALMAAHEIIAAVETHRARHIVITGGEPCQYDLRELSHLAARSGHVLQVETSGTEKIQIAPGAWVTVSPKIGMPGGKQVRQDALVRADEIKMPVGKKADVETLARLLEGPGRDFHGPVWLQPLSRSERATALCVEAATRAGWRVSIQTHHFAGLR